MLETSNHLMILFVLSMQISFQEICFPSTQECKRISNAFHFEYGIPNVVGVIDGCHIRIVTPEETINAVHPDKYYNRKSFHSVSQIGIVHK
jgi:hypothetical protein